MTHQQLMTLLNQCDFTATASEIHGLLTGLVSGGMSQHSDDHQAHLADLFNNGALLEPKLSNAVSELLALIFAQIDSDDMSFQLMLLDEEETLSDQATELVNWVQYFLVGFGLNKKDLKSASNELREIIEDLTHITHLETDMEESNEAYADFYEIIEFIRIAAILCHQEFGKKMNIDETKAKTLH